MLVSHADHSTGFLGLSHTSPSPSLCLLWPVGVIRESGILPDFLVSPDGRLWARGRELPNLHQEAEKMLGVGGGAGMGSPGREEGAETQKPRLVTEAAQTGPAGHGFHGGRGRREGGMTREDWTLPHVPGCPPHLQAQSATVAVLSPTCRQSLKT